MILHSQILGEGRPFIILHGLLGMGDNWKHLPGNFHFWDLKFISWTSGTMGGAFIATILTMSFWRKTYITIVSITA